MPVGKLLKERRDSRQYFSIVAREMPGEMAKVASQESLPVFLGRFESMSPQEVSSNGPIRAAAKWHAMIDAAHAELRDQGSLHGRLAGAAACKKGSIDVEKANIHAGI